MKRPMQPKAGADPTTPAEWQEAVNWAEFWLMFDSARQYGLVIGGPEIHLPRCEEILRRGKVRGYRPSQDFLEQCTSAVLEAQRQGVR